MNRIALIIVAVSLAGCKSAEVQQWTDAVQQGVVVAKPVVPPDVAADLDKASQAAGSLRDATEGRDGLTALEVLKAATDAARPHVPEPYGTYLALGSAALTLVGGWFAGRKQGTNIASEIAKGVQLGRIGESKTVDLSKVRMTPRAKKIVDEATAPK